MKRTLEGYWVSASKLKSEGRTRYDKWTDSFRFENEYGDKCLCIPIIYKKKQKAHFKGRKAKLRVTIEKIK